MQVEKKYVLKIMKMCQEPLYDCPEPLVEVIFRKKPCNYTHMYKLKGQNLVINAMDHARLQLLINK